jgi:hypothetical protein
MVLDTDVTKEGIVGVLGTDGGLDIPGSLYMDRWTGSKKYIVSVLNPRHWVGLTSLGWCE